MDFKTKEQSTVGKALGFIFSFFLFTIIFFFLFKLLNKVPLGGSYLHFFATSTSIVLIGTLLRQLLK